MIVTLLLEQSHASEAFRAKYKVSKSVPAGKSQNH